MRTISIATDHRVARARHQLRRPVYWIGNPDELRPKLPDDASIIESSRAFAGGTRGIELGIEE